jgi:Ca2+-binding RTX toxin-like protein
MGMRGGSRAIRSLLLALLAAIGTGAYAAPAWAGTIGISGGTLTFDATGVSEANNVKFAFTAGSYTVTDTVGMVDGDGAGGCTVAPATTATCPGLTVTHVTVMTGDLNDLVCLSSTGGGPPCAGVGGGITVPTTIDGGAAALAPPGAKVLGNRLYGSGGNDLFVNGTAAAGNDRMFGQDGVDTVSYAERTGPVYVDMPPSTSCNGEAPVGTSFPPPASSAADPTPLLECDIPDQASIENIVGGAGDDMLLGSQFDNLIVGGPGADTICGNVGVDTADYTDHGSADLNVTLDGSLPPFHPNVPDPNPRTNCIGQRAPPGSDDETIAKYTQAGLKDCIANDGAAGENDCVGRDTENITGGIGDDVLVGNDNVEPTGFVDPSARISGQNALFGRAGDDTLRGMGSSDLLQGGTGTDTVTYSERSTAVDASIDGASNDGGSEDLDPVSGRQDTVDTDVEKLVGGSAGDLLVGNEEVNILVGNGGDDTLRGKGDDDGLSGGDGKDTLEGGTGIDSVLGEGGDDSVYGGDGNDGLDGGDGNDLLNGGFGKDAIGGGAGSDVADYADALGTVHVTPLDGVRNDGRTGEEDDVASDVEGANGGIDNDVLEGNNAAGTLNGGGGDDLLNGNGGPDVMLGGAGSDTASYEGRTAPVAVSIGGSADGQAGEGDSVGADIERVVGGSSNDTLNGNDLSNILLGGPGNDTVNAGGAFDLLIGGLGNDTLNGDAGDDVLSGNGGNDRLGGGDGKDTLNGGLGDDRLDGALGADIFSGDGGLDTAFYGGRSKGVKVMLDGAPNDGETREGDFIKTDIASVTTGSGNDKINSNDGRAGKIACGKGKDRVTTDGLDDVAGDCESVTPKLCSISARSAKLKRGKATVRIRCIKAVSGTIRVAKKGKLGQKRFKIAKASGGTKKVKVKINSKGRRQIGKRGRLRVKVTASVRQTGVTKSASRKFTRRITIKASKGR